MTALSFLVTYLPRLNKIILTYTKTSCLVRLQHGFFPIAQVSV